MLFSARKTLLLLTSILCALGLLFVFEASVAEAYNMIGDQYYFLKQQSVRLVIGIGALAIGYIIPSQFWRKISPLLYVCSIILLILVFVPHIGLELNGAHRWISLNGFSFQPIELVKLSLIFFFATWMTQHQRLGPFLFLTAIPTILVILQPDLGSLLVVLSIAFGLYFMAGGKIGALLTIGGVGVLFLIIVISTSEYRMKRVVSYINPESDPLGASFHIRQITLALGNGGLIGQGLGNSRQKYSYIPEASSDSIFAIIAEELGFMGSAVIIGLFGWYLYAALSLVSKIPDDSFEYLLAVGILIWIAAQIVLNLAAVVALVPLTGVPLPFFSYGGTSLVMVLLATGVFLRATQSTKLKKS